MIKLRSLLNEVDEDVLEKKVKYKDEKTGEDREIKVSTALTYPKEHPAYKEAKKLTGGKDKSDIDAEKEKSSSDKQEPEPKKKSGEEKKDVETGKSPEEEKGEPKGAALFKPGNSAHDIAKKQDDEKEKDAHSSHGHGHGHGVSNLSRRKRLALAAVDVAVKALHIPGLENVAGQIEKVASTTKEVYDEAKHATGFLNKVKAIGNVAKSKIQKAGEEFATKFTNSLHEENSGQRKSLGKILANKGKAAIKGVYDGIKGEIEHIGHGLKDGVEVAKKVIREGPKSINDDDKHKIVNAVRAVADVAIIGIAVSAGPVGMALKSASLSLNPGHILQKIITADVYHDLMRTGKLRIIRESRISDYDNMMRLIESAVEQNIESLDDNRLLDILVSEGANELQRVDNPFESYSEEDMDLCVDYSVYASEVEAAKGDEGTKKALIAAAKKKKASQQPSETQPGLQ